MNLDEIASRPLFFEGNRVFRVYTGGRLLGEFLDKPEPDGDHPEEWIASSVRALNRVSEGPKEGVSRIRGTDIYLDDLMETHRAALLGKRSELGILVKYLDSAIRLPIQAHPNRAFSMDHFHSRHGKAEMWLLLATRPDACLYFGFKRAVTREEFVAAIERSQTHRDAMVPLLNRVAVSPGDVYFIPPRAVHAIGPGCLILEIQEPTDFTLQPEAFCGDYALNDYEKYLGLPRDTALECFDFSLWGQKALAAGRKMPKLVCDNGSIRTEGLLGPAETDCFSVSRFAIHGGQLQGLSGPAIYVITEGRGSLTCGEERIPLSRGEYFLMPYAASNQWALHSELGLTAVACMPGRG